MSWLGRLFFKCPIGDFHCGLRAFRKDAIDGLHLQSLGMEFASAVTVKATLFRLRVTEVPTVLSPRARPAPTSSALGVTAGGTYVFFSADSPRWLFLYPGIALLLLGGAVGVWFIPGPRSLGSVTFDLHTLLFGAMAVLIGFQSIDFATFSKVFAIREGLLP